MTSAALDNLIDPVGEQAVRLPVDSDPCVRIRSIDQAEEGAPAIAKSGRKRGTSPWDLQAAF
jgi:hypothetical protein